MNNINNQNNFNMNNQNPQPGFNPNPGFNQVQVQVNPEIEAVNKEKEANLEKLAKKINMPTNKIKNYLTLVCLGFVGGIGSLICQSDGKVNSMISIAVVISALTVIATMFSLSFKKQFSRGILVLGNLTSGAIQIAIGIVMLVNSLNTSVYKSPVEVILFALAVILFGVGSIILAVMANKYFANDKKYAFYNQALSYEKTTFIPAIVVTAIGSLFQLIAIIMTLVTKIEYNIGIWSEIFAFFFIIIPPINVVAMNCAIARKKTGVIIIGGLVIAIAILGLIDDIILLTSMYASDGGSFILPTTFSMLFAFAFTMMIGCGVIGAIKVCGADSEDGNIIKPKQVVMQQPVINSIPQAVNNQFANANVNQPINHQNGFNNPQAQGVVNGNGMQVGNVNPTVNQQINNQNGFNNPQPQGAVNGNGAQANNVNPTVNQPNVENNNTFNQQVQQTPQVETNNNNQEPKPF